MFQVGSKFGNGFLVANSWARNFGGKKLAYRPHMLVMWGADCDLPDAQGEFGDQRKSGRPRTRRRAEAISHMKNRNATIASVICTQSPKFPRVASVRSPQGYGKTEHAASISDVVVRFHHASHSGR